jgi:glutathione S-transferase
MTTLTLVIGNKNYSSWSLRPWLALRQMGLEFEEIRIPLYQPGAADQLRQYSPAAKVPVLIHEGVTVWDSGAILTYLSEAFPAFPWLPLDRTARAIAYSISAEMHSSFLALREQMPMNCRDCFPSRSVSAAVQKDIDRITTLWQDCRQQYRREGEFLLGRFSVADAMYAPVVLRFATYGVSLSPVNQAYADAIQSLPAVQAWVEAAQQESETIAAYEPPSQG